MPRMLCGHDSDGTTGTGSPVHLGCWKIGGNLVDTSAEIINILAGRTARCVVDGDPIRDIESNDCAKSFVHKPGEEFDSYDCDRH